VGPRCVPNYSEFARSLSAHTKPNYGYEEGQADEKDADLQSSVHTVRSVQEVPGILDKLKVPICHPLCVLASQRRVRRAA